MSELLNSVVAQEQHTLTLDKIHEDKSGKLQDLFHTFIEAKAADPAAAALGIDYEELIKKNGKGLDFDKDEPELMRRVLSEFSELLADATNVWETIVRRGIAPILLRATVPLNIGKDELELFIKGIGVRSPHALKQLRTNMEAVELAAHERDTVEKSGKIKGEMDKLAGPYANLKAALPGIMRRKEAPPATHRLQSIIAAMGGNAENVTQKDVTRTYRPASRLWTKQTVTEKEDVKVNVAERINTLIGEYQVFQDQLRHAGMQFLNGINLRGETENVDFFNRITEIAEKALKNPKLKPQNQLMGQDEIAAEVSDEAMRTNYKKFMQGKLTPAEYAAFEAEFNNDSTDETTFYDTPRTLGSSTKSYGSFYEEFADSVEQKIKNRGILSKLYELLWGVKIYDLKDESMREILRQRT